MRKWYPAVLLVAVSAVSIIAYPHLPERVPTHWDLHNHVNGYSSRLGAAIMLPLVLAGIWALMRLLPIVDPRRQNYAKFQREYDLVVNATLTLIAAIHVAIVAGALGYPIGISRVLPAAMGALLVVMGNVLPRARPNWWFGIRTPWTMSNDRVWERTHRVGGYLFVGSGVLIMLAVFLPPAVATFITIGGVTAAALGSVLYSLYAWKQETSQ